jgi:hypothetical protein
MEQRAEPGERGTVLGGFEMEAGARREGDGGRERGRRRGAGDRYSNQFSREKSYVTVSTLVTVNLSLFLNYLTRQFFLLSWKYRLRYPHWGQSKA